MEESVTLGSLGRWGFERGPTIKCLLDISRDGRIDHISFGGQMSSSNVWCGAKAVSKHITDIYTSRYGRLNANDVIPSWSYAWDATFDAEQTGSDRANWQRSISLSKRYCQHTSACLTGYTSLVRSWPCIHAILTKKAPTITPGHTRTHPFLFSLRLGGPTTASLSWSAFRSANNLSSSPRIVLKARRSN